MGTGWYQASSKVLKTQDVLIRKLSVLANRSALVSGSLRAVGAPEIAKPLKLYPPSFQFPPALGSSGKPRE